MATEKIQFTNTAVQAIQHPAKGRVMYRDIKCSHLYLYATAKTKVFYFVRKVSGRTLQIKLSPCNDIDVVKAREMVNDKNKKIADGIDLQEEKNFNKKSC